MDTRINEKMTVFNQTYKEMDDTYHNYAKRCGLSDSAFWVLYSMLENDRVYTQRELCAEWFYSPQTINSTLKGMEKQGLIELVPVPGKRKDKQIVLTASGNALMRSVLVPLVNAEQEALLNLTEEEQTALLSLTKNYSALFRAQINQITEMSSEDESSQ